MCSEKGIDVPIVREVESDKGKLRKEIAEDKTLLHLRGFADRGEKRYFWRDGLLLHTLDGDAGKAW